MLPCRKTDTLGLGFFQLIPPKNTAVQGFGLCTTFFHFCQVTTSLSLYLCTAKSHVKVLLPQQGYL